MRGFGRYVNNISWRDVVPLTSLNRGASHVSAHPGLSAGQWFGIDQRPAEDECSASTLDNPQINEVRMEFRRTRAYSMDETDFMVAIIPQSLTGGVIGPNLGVKNFFVLLKVRKFPHAESCVEPIRALFPVLLNLAGVCLTTARFLIQTPRKAR